MADGQEDRLPSSYPPPTIPSQNNPADSLPTPSPDSSDAETDRMTRADRPRFARSSSDSRNANGMFSPEDARAMSPRRNSEDVERLGSQARDSIQRHARSLQASLQELADRIDEVRSDHDKLEAENRFLQDYIGGLTRTMSCKTDLTSSSGQSRGRRHHK